MASVRDHEITVAISANGTGKTHCAARIACWFKLVYGQEAQVLTAAAPPENNLKTILWGEIGSILQKHPDLFDSYTVTSLKIEDSPKSFILGLTIPSSGTPAEREAKFSGKHANYLLFILDEGDAIPDEVYKGIESCMSGGVIVRLLVMFNPRNRAGAVHRMIRDGLANVVSLSAFNHPNVLTGQNIIPGAVTMETTVRRINQWTREAHADETEGDFFDVPDFLVGAVAKSQSSKAYPPIPAGRRKIENPAFSYMVLGRYPSQGSDQLISREWVDNARARYDAYVAQHGEVPPAGTRPKMGLDVAEYGDDYNVATFRYGGWVAPFKFWNGIDRTITSQRAATLYKERRATKAFVDASGIGKWIAPNMDGCNAQSVYVGDAPTVDVEEGQFKSMRCQLWWMVREWLRTDPGAMLPPDEMLIEELLNPTYYWNTRGKIEVKDKDTMKEELKRSPDRADSLALTFAPDESVIDGLDVESCAA
jgi:hypothetical protein